MRIHFKLVKQFIKDKYASSLIEYSMGLAAIGLAIILGTTSSGQAIKNYMFCIATGGTCDAQPAPENDKSKK